MCGIVGIMEYARGRGVRREVLERMCATLVHRGPDDVGVWATESVGIAMRRLSIVDVAHGHQPITNETGDCDIVFNGEIYNHRALRAELEGRGHVFKTHTDTETILHLYEEYGEASFDRLEGMFAIAIVDSRKSKERPELVLARDRLGKKPLYYADRDGTLIFGSELKAILAHDSVSRDLDIEALHHYLSLMMVPEPFSIYRDVRKLPPGTSARWTRDGMTVRSYWSYADAVGERHVEQSRLSGDVRNMLFSAVEKRLDLDVPFGAMLSGGLDSGAVVGIMSKLVSRPVKTFSIGFEGPASHDERPRAALTAKHFGTEHHELLARPSIVELIHELVHFTDEPFAISSAIPLFLLAREAHKSVKVVFTGDGGDEVFGGYSYYRWERWARLWRHLPSVVDRALLQTAARVRGTDRIAKFINNARRTTGERRLGWAAGFSELEKRELTAGSSANWNHPTTPSLLDSRLAAFSELSPDAQVNALDVLVWLPGEMLAKVDRMTMAHSVEARSPLLDDVLVSTLARIRFGDRAAVRSDGQSKEVLRSALRDLLPPHLISGGKWGFNVPLDTWFSGAAAPFVDATLSRERIAKRGLFDADAIARLVAAQRAGHVRASGKLFALMVFEVWAEKHL